jgi:predicted thioesterase
MKQPFQIGDLQVFETEVLPADTAAFHGEVVHPLYSTFALTRDAEWTCRLFVLEMLEAGEEGVGVHVAVNHLAPARVGSVVRFEARLQRVLNNEVVCSFGAWCGPRKVAEGIQIQKIIDEKRFRTYIQTL